MRRRFVQWFMRLADRLLPAHMRPHADEMRATLAALEDDAWRRSLWVWLRFWLRELTSLVSTVSREKQRGLRATNRRRRKPSYATRIEALVREGALSIRFLLRRPGFLIVSAMSLGFGIAVATVIASGIYAMLFRASPGVHAPERLVAIFTSEYEGPPYGVSSLPDYGDFGRVDGLESLAAYRTDTVRLGEGERVLEGLMEVVTSNYFDVLGLKMVLGRGFLTGESNAGTAVVGYGLWQREFGGRPSALGESLRVGGTDFFIVGVAPKGTLARQAPVAVDVWIPLDETDRRVDGRDARALGIVGRLEANTDIQRVRSGLDLVAGRLFAEFPETWTDARGAGRRVTVIPAAQSTVPPEDRAVLYVASGGVMAVVAIVLLIACSNVSNLFLSRILSRRTETSVRWSLGASRSRVIFLWVCEAAVVAALAGAIGLTIAFWLTELLAVGVIPTGLPAAVDFTLDKAMLLFASLVALGCALAIVCIPTMTASRMRAFAGPSASSRMDGLGRWFSIRNVLVMMQVGGSLVLLIGAALFIRSLSSAATIDLGFEPEGVVVMDVNLDATGLQAGELLQRLGEPEAALARSIPLGPSRENQRVVFEDAERNTDEHLIPSNLVTPGYFALMRMPLLQGRDFGASDREGTPRVAVVNEAFVRRFWPNEEPVGKRFRIQQEPVIVVGLVRDATYRRLGEASIPHIWTPLEQNHRDRVSLHVRASNESEHVIVRTKETLEAMSPNVILGPPKPMEQAMSGATLPQRLLSLLLGITGIGALLLAALGIYGVMAFRVGQRTREVGVRMSVGAGPSQILIWIIRDGLMLTLPGMLVGLAVVTGATEAIASLLFGLAPRDPLAFAAGISTLGITSVAVILPSAFRAARLDPVAALRR